MQNELVLDFIVTEYHSIKTKSEIRPPKLILQLGRIKSKPNFETWPQPKGPLISFDWWWVINELCTGALIGLNLITELRVNAAWDTAWDETQSGGTTSRQNDSASGSGDENKKIN